MKSPSVERKFAAVLAADVAGYTRLMDTDEDATMAAWWSHRQELIDAKITERRGRIVKLTGDGFLAEFPSAVDAVRCAVDVQKEVARRNADTPMDRRMEFRIGVNLCDIMADDEDIYGHGVNLAARLEELADAGGICISRPVYEQVKHNLELGYEHLGERQLKNIAEAVDVYKIRLERGTSSSVDEPKAGTKYRRYGALAAAVVLLAGGTAVALWVRPWDPPLEVAAPATNLPSDDLISTIPDKPSVAVLPFDNISDEAEQEYFADGITDDLITDLSKVAGLFVSARNAVLPYKNQPVKIRQVAEELGVRYVLEGSVRKSGDKVRINAQLIDAATGGHLWAERYDGSLADVFALQDEVTEQIVAALAVSLSAGEQALRARKETVSPKAHDAFLQGWALVQRSTPEDFAKAVPWLEEAIEEDPGYGRAYAALAALYRVSWSWGSYKSLGISRAETLGRAKQYVQEAMKYPTPLAHQVASNIWSTEGRYEQAITEAERAIALDADDPAGYYAMGSALIYAVSPSEGAEFLYKAMELNPHYPPEYVFWLGMASFCMERFDEAAISLERSRKLVPADVNTTLALAATYGHLGREQEAKSIIATLNGLVVQAGYENGVRDIDIWPFKEPADRERVRAGLRKAGLSDLPRG